MKFTTVSIGGRLIESITAGLYDGNLNCLREYIQNSIDEEAKNVEIYFENGNKDLIIKDDGHGMSRDELEAALSIGVSNKKEEDAGWRGIGIWSGISSCKRIVIITKKKNDKKYRIEIDNDNLRNEYLSNKPVLDILTGVTGEIVELPLGKDDSFENDHFTEVRLESILPPQKNIFTEKEIQKYLWRNVPAPFDEKKFSFASDIDKWLEEKNVRPQKVNIEFNGNKIFRPPLSSDIFFDKITKKEFVDINGKLIAVGWFLTSNENKVLKEPNSGIYFKKKGFTIGNENTVRNQFSGTYNAWQYGEIHIISKELRENSSRNSFELNNTIVLPFLEDVGKFIGQLQMQNRFQSSNIDSNTIKKTHKLLDVGDYKSAEKNITKFRKNSTVNFPIDPALQEMKPLIETVSKQEKQEIDDLEGKIQQMKPDIQNKKKEQLEALINNLPTQVKNSIKRATKKGQKYPEMSVTDPIRKILQEKTELDDNEIFNLSRAAYGWENITQADKPPLLVIDPVKDPGRGNTHRNRNLRFGVMVYTLHDLFVNLSKHETGKESRKWYEDATDDENYEMLGYMYSLIGLIYRMIEKSEKYQP
ncbi:MAG: ATP-binding protein [ANME-2 cluster archaeon]|nr:ATP-binding protein [ANME-2 cluster archaeon]